MDTGAVEGQVAAKHPPAWFFHGVRKEQRITGGAVLDHSMWLTIGWVPRSTVISTAPSVQSLLREQ